jgi:putative tail protein
MAPRVTLHENPFNLLRDRRALVLTDGETLGAALEREQLGDDFVFTCNGEVLPPERALAHVPANGEDLALVPVLHNSALRIIALIGVAIAAAAATYFTGGLAAPWVAAAVGAVVSAGGSLLVNFIASLFQKKPGGSNYGVLGPVTTGRSGIPIPKSYGTMRSAGNITESWIDIQGNNEDQHDVDDGADTIGRQYINVRIDFGWGPLFAYSNVMLNGKDIREFADVSYAMLYGSNDQTPVVEGDARWQIINQTTTGTTTNTQPTTNFNTINNNYPQQQRVRAGVPQNFVIIAGTRTDTTTIGVYVVFPQGVWRLDDNNVQKRAAISYDVFIRPSATATSAPGAWQHIPPYWSTPNGETHYYYNIRTCPLRQFTWANVAPGCWDVMVQKNGAGAVNNPLDYFEHESNLWGDELWVESTQETSATTLSYPNRIQMLVRIMASDSINGSDINVSIDGNFGLRSTLPPALAAYAAETPNNGSDIPACVAYDIMTDDLIGANLPDSQKDMNFLAAWAALTESLVNNGDGGTQSLAKFNGTLQQDGLSIWGALQMVAGMSYANLQQMGLLITGWLDQADVPVQMFGPGSMLKDSYSKEYLNVEDRAQEIEVTFADIADNYKTRNPERVVYAQDETSDEALKKTQVNLVGCTNRVQAYYWGAQKLAESETLIRTHSWKSNANAIRCRTGNIVLLSQDVSQYGFSGLVQPGSTASEIVIDRTDVVWSSGANAIVCHPSLERMTIAITTIVTVDGVVTLTVTGYDGVTPVKRLQQGSGSALIDVGVTAVNSTTLTVGVEFNATGLANGAATLWDLDVLETRTVTGIANGVLTLGTPLSIAPVALSTQYIFQTTTQVAVPVRIHSISKDIGTQRFTVRAIDYSNSTYDIPPPLPGLSYTPPMGTPAPTPNPVNEAYLQVVYTIVTGS